MRSVTDAFPAPFGARAGEWIQFRCVDMNHMAVTILCFFRIGVASYLMINEPMIIAGKFSRMSYVCGGMWPADRCFRSIHINLNCSVRQDIGIAFEYLSNQRSWSCGFRAAEYSPPEKLPEFTQQTKELFHNAFVVVGAISQCRNKLRNHRPQQQPHQITT